MIGLDTNVLLRYSLQDEPLQAAAAERLIESRCTEESPGIIPLITLCELVWVLQSGYRYGRAEVIDLSQKILAANDMRVEQAELAEEALTLYQDGKADFADYLIGLIGRRQAAETTYAFDRAAADCPLFTILAT